MLETKRKVQVALLITFLLGLAVAQISTVLWHQEMAFIKAGGLEDPLEAWSESSYVIWKYNSTHTAARNMSTLLVDCFNANESYVIDTVDSSISEGNVFIKTGTYNLDSVTLDSEICWVGEEGTVWNLTAKPCLTVNSETTFNNINFTSIVDGNGHFVIKGCVTFEKCDFDFQVSTAESTGVITCNPTTDKTVYFKDCTITKGGKSGATFFTFFSVNANMTKISIDTLTILETISSGKTTIFNVDGNLSIFEAKNIYIEKVTLETNTQAFFFRKGSTYALDSLLVDGFFFWGGGSWGGTNAYLDPFGFFSPACKYAKIKNVIARDRMHIVMQAEEFILDGLIYEKNYGDTFGSCIDLGSSATTPLHASLSNLHITNGSVTMNTGWVSLTLSNSIFISTRLAIMDEGSPTGQAKNLLVSNCDWNYASGGKFDYAILFSYDQGINLANMQVTNCHFKNVPTIFALSGNSSASSRISLDNCVVAPKIDSSHPRLFGGTSRFDANATVHISDSYICTDNPPLRDWNPSLVGDKFENVKFNDNDVITYSERSGTIVNASATTWTITHGLVGNPQDNGGVWCSFNSTNIDSWRWTSTSTTITVTCVNRATTDAIVACYWYAEYRP